MSHQAIVQSLLALATAYDKEMPKERMKVYLMALEGLTVEQVNAAVTRAIMASDAFMPTPGQLRAMAEVPAEARASAAWASVLDAIRSCGAYRAPTFPDPLVTVAVRRLGGWQGLCQRESAWLQEWGRKAFAAEYESLCVHGLAPGEEHLQLEGIHKKQIEAPKPVKQLESGYDAEARRQAMEAIAKLTEGK